MNSTYVCGTGTAINYVIKNSRMIEVFTNSTCNITYDKRNITSVTIGNTTFSLGYEFEHEYSLIPSSYVINSIHLEEDKTRKGGYKNKFTFITHLQNKTTTYMLPCLGKDMYFFNTEEYFINAYFSEDKTSLNVMYRFSKSDDYFNKVEKVLLTHPLYEKYDNSLSKEGFDVFKFRVPDEHYGDVKMFFQGRYSRLGEDLKNKIKFFYKLTPKSYIHQVLHRDKELKKRLESWFGCDMDGVDLEEKPKKEFEIWKH